MELLKLPYTRLTQTANGFVSLLDGKSLKVCEVIFESDESMVSWGVFILNFNNLSIGRGGILMKI